jgi:hypothetical protein
MAVFNTLFLSDACLQILHRFQCPTPTPQSSSKVGLYRSMTRSCSPARKARELWLKSWRAGNGRYLGTRAQKGYSEGQSAVLPTPRLPQATTKQHPEPRSSRHEGLGRSRCPPRLKTHTGPRDQEARHTIPRCLIRPHRGRSYPDR